MICPHFSGFSLPKPAHLDEAMKGKQDAFELS